MNQALIELNKNLLNPFRRYRYLDIQAEPDIKSEQVNFNSNSQYTCQADGRGVTELLVRCLNEEKGHAIGRQPLIEKKLLEKINTVTSPDIIFTRILSKIDEQGTYWEIYLEQEHKGGIKLSDCGSGIKTIIFVMTLLYVVPEIQKTNKIVFSFEELENNLHPALERKLLAHIRDYIKENQDSLLFLTTHSNIAIDMFSNYEDAQILKVSNDGKASYIEPVRCWQDQHNLLDDLGVKASDILQSNCIVWLEGPSDRIYFNKWIELFNEEQGLEEGVHYQCIFYGGAVLSHYSANIDDSEDNFIKMLKINRNAVIMMDSDKSSNRKQLKGRVKRVCSEAEELSSIITWVTKGREVENYLPSEALQEYFEKEVEISPYDSFAEKFKKSKKVETFDKVKFASEIIEQESYNIENLDKVLDLKEKMLEIIKHIRNCNNDSY